jgi:solute carrier family 12 (sodium/potassium/chloride transporter), member 2
MIKNNSGYSFGTFQGVFTPSILTILGVVMYLRFGWVLGQVGIYKTILIVLLATSVTFITSLALASLATNMRVEGGGAYYIISRSLGLETGAAVGLPLFLAQALGISFYIAGFSESVSQLLPAFSPVHIGILTLIALTAVAYFSANLALKIQYFIMAAIALSLVSFFLGDATSIPEVDPADTVVSYLSFWVVFAVFFPAVTGIEAGISLSGDLKNPAKSLPWGTFTAIATGFLIYLAIPIFLHTLEIPNALLIQDPLIMQKIAWSGNLVLLGIWGASLSSAMGALLGAPRTLQALSLDGVLPRIIGRGFGPSNDPRIATIISFGISLTGVILGDLNLIAPILSMFFLTSYGLLNLSSGFENLVSAPSWRPTFRTSASINFIGAFLCFIIMIMIDAGASILALGFSGGVYFYFKKKSLATHFGDARQGILLSLTKYATDQLSKSRLTERSWKPNILCLCGHPGSRWYLVDFAHATTSEGRSFLTIASVLPSLDISGDRIASTQKVIKDYVNKRGISSQVKVIRARSIFEGLTSLVEAYGFGPVVPNTILLGATEEVSHLESFTGLVHLICELKRNLVILRVLDENANISTGKNIDIWWARQSNNAGLMLALAYQMRKSHGWSKLNITLKTIVNTKSNTEKSEELTPLEKFIKRERLPAVAEEVIMVDNIFSTIRNSSKDADLVMLGLRAPSEVDETSYIEYYTKLLSDIEGFPPTALVYAAEEISFKDIFRN